MPQVSYPVSAIPRLNLRMNKHALPLRPIALATLLIRVKTAPTIQHQIDLLCEAGVFHSVNKFPVAELNWLFICPGCGSISATRRPYGNLLVLEFIVQQSVLTFTSREAREECLTALEQILKDPRYFRSNLDNLIGRLTFKSIRPSNSRPTPVDPFDAPEPNSCRPEPRNAKEEFHPVKAPTPTWVPVEATSYSWRIDRRQNRMEGNLSGRVEGLKQCAADLRYYPLGSVLCIKSDHSEEFRIVTDCIESVQGPHQLGLHFDSIEMVTNRTHYALVLLVRKGWN